MSSTLKELYQLRLKQLGDPSIFTELYYCGSLHHPERINKIMSNGFSDEGKIHVTVERILESVCYCLMWKDVYCGKIWRMSSVDILWKDVYCGKTGRVCTLERV